jgi:hypothetical protein
MFQKQDEAQLVATRIMQKLMQSPEAMNHESNMPAFAALPGE